MNDPFASSTAQRGQGLVEYALILVLVAVAVIIGLSVVGTSTQGVFCNVVAGLQQSDSALCAAPDNGLQEDKPQEDRQCQVTELPKEKDKGTPQDKIRYSLFKMKDGEWVFQKESKNSFGVAECPAGVSKHK